MFSYVWNVIDAINETCSFSFPTDYQSLLNIEAGFRAKSRLNVMKGCLGCTDGVHFPMTNPGNKIKDPMRYCVQKRLNTQCCAWPVVTATGNLLFLLL